MAAHDGRVAAEQLAAGGRVRRGGGARAHALPAVRSACAVGGVDVAAVHTLVAEGPAGEAEGVPHDTLFWTQDHYRVVRHEGWKLQRNGPDDEFAWLFDLASDPTEQRNLAKERPDKVRELDTLLAAHLAEQAPPRWDSNVSMAISVDKHLNQPESPEDEVIYYPN